MITHLLCKNPNIASKKVRICPSSLRIFIKVSSCLSFPFISADRVKPKTRASNNSVTVTRTCEHTTQSQTTNAKLNTNTKDFELGGRIGQQRHRVSTFH